MEKSANKTNRLEGWQRKLLDLTMRNVMLNLRPSKTIIALNEHRPEAIVDLLRENRLAEIIGKNKEERLEILKTLYRESRNSLNENGTNTLYVSLGTLRWFERDSAEPRVAPLIFIPLEIVRRKAMTFEIRMLDEDPMLNVTLLEMLRRDYGATFPELNPLPMVTFEPEALGDEESEPHNIFDQNDDFPDWELIFRVLTEHVDAINEHQPEGRKWQMPMQSFVGLFSFTKFLMWHDINQHEEQVHAHDLLGNLSENRQLLSTQVALSAADIEKQSPLDLMLPIDYDSSQLVAVAEADRGSSFVLHGPPGTGKSQTITNIIANALFKGKRVLFVSEKKAALEVVQSRLAALGLDPFCLELHSNKAQKRSFFNQLRDAEMDLVKFVHERVDFPTSYNGKSQRLAESLARLRELTDAIHQDRESRMSLYGFISEMSKIEGEILNLTDSELAFLTPDDIAGLVETIRQLDTVQQILGRHPAESPLLGLYPFENTIEAQTSLQQTLAKLPAVIAKVRRKANGIINRWFMKRTPEEILAQRNEWQQLEALAAMGIGDSIDAKESAVMRWKDSTAGLRKWHHFVERAHTLRQSSPSALSYYLEGKTGRAAADAFAKGFYGGKAQKVVDGDNRLRSFNGLLHKTTLTSYREADADFRRIATQVLNEEMLNRLRSITLNEEEQKELALLERRIFNKGRGVSLRQIVNDSRHVLHRLFPCMLMSPLSVAQFLDMEPGLFDLVIFDEASQMETPDAIGAIVRGRQTIIVGDPKQLPPTTFFTAGVNSSDTEEESQDADSILEDALAIGMPSLYLTRHYRSRHESLIAFSNYMFYDGRLLTFPSVNDSERKVSHIDPNGVYDYGKTRTNQIEAKAVVDYVVGRLEKAPESIGIVTFSKAQSNLIDDLLTTALSRNKAAAANLERSGEPLFVKNLESVQGDERDIIIFSVGYGPDKDGKVSLNFGPLNQQGGERRLNVAVTRAKSEMVVFSSLKPEHIPDDATLPKGVVALRAFIAYAINGLLPEIENRAANADDNLVEQIASRLRRAGLEVTTNVGRSDFRVDIAIADPNNPGAYSLGLILDGLNYAALPTVRDREITIPTVLGNLGWRINRLWALDWLDNPDAVVGNVTAALTPRD